jgi:LuxR family maltose regulon positive regulatory protein
MERMGRVQNVIETVTLQAVARHARGERALAAATLERALALAEPGRYVRLIIDKGPAVAAILALALVARRDDKGGDGPRASAAYLRRLEVACTPDAGGEYPPGPSPVAAAGLPVPLTARERATLRLIADGLTNREIADHLFIATSTVKSYVNAIFGKLGTPTRTGAVARGRALGLLDD